MSDENILNIEEEPSGQSQPLAATVDQLENREDWEQELLAGTSRLFRDTLSPISDGIESLRRSIQVMADALNSVSPESSLAPDLGKLVAAVRTSFVESSQQAAESHRQQLAVEREGWAAELERRLEETRNELQQEAEARIGELEGQLRAGREALELVVRSTTNRAIVAPDTVIDRTRDLKLAIEEIDAQRSQADTLTLLVEHAAKFAPRVLFFVVRGGMANGWKAGGFGQGLNDETVRTISIPVDDHSLIGRALLSFESETGDGVERVLGGLADRPTSGALAIPLVVRGRSAAVLYADAADKAEKELDVTSLEIIMRVTAMAIELLPTRRGETAAGTTGKPAGQVSAVTRGTMPLPKPTPQTPDPAPAAQTTSTPVTSHETPSNLPPHSHQVAGRPAGGETRELHTFSVGITDAPTDTVPAISVPPPPSATGGGEAWGVEPTPEPGEQLTEQDHFATNTYDQNLAPGPASAGPPPPSLSETTTDDGWPASKLSPGISDQSMSPERITKPVPGFERASQLSRDTVPPPVAVAQSTESEQRAHNDARRFARLLVSEIKLYNGVKVSEGRRNYDLYSRLAEEIDRSRKVYDKRVSPAVAARFDYFYDELVQTLADGDKEKLGADCPGPQLR